QSPQLAVDRELHGTWNHWSVHQLKCLIRLAGSGAERLSDHLNLLGDACGLDADPTQARVQARRNGASRRLLHANANPGDEPADDIGIVERGRVITDTVFQRSEVVPLADAAGGGN